MPSSGEPSVSSTSTEPDQTMDVLETENVLLECRFSPREVLGGGSGRDRDSRERERPLLYWIRTNRRGHDNVAIDDAELENNYS